MVSESKYTSPPKIPSGSNVPALLTRKVINMPKATGRSMLICRCRRSRNALVKKGPQENSMTGKVSTQDAQRSRRSISGVMSPGPAT